MSDQSFAKLQEAKASIVKIPLAFYVWARAARCNVHTNIVTLQKLGGAVTYLRRYTLSSLLGLQSEDDDGNAASNASVKSSAPKAKDKLSKDRFDNAVKQYKNNPEYIKDNLRKYTLDEVQLNILSKNKIVL